MYYSYMAQDFFHQCLNFLTFLKSKPPPPMMRKMIFLLCLWGDATFCFCGSRAFFSPRLCREWRSPLHPEIMGFPPPK